MGCAVEGGELFSGIGLADNDSLAGEGVEVKCMEGLTDFEHDIVCEVYEKRDWALTDLSKAFLEPFGAGAVLEVLENAGGVASAECGLDFDGGFGPDVAIVSVGGRESVGGSCVKFRRLAGGVFGEEFA